MWSLWINTSVFRMLQLFNTSLKFQYTLQEWGRTGIISIRKKRVRSVLGNYRGISLLDSADKQYVAILN